MMRTWGSRLGMAALTAVLAVLVHPSQTQAEEPASASSIRIGLVNTLFRDTPESLVQLMTRPLKSLMESQTGMTGTLVPGGEARNLGRAGQRIATAMGHRVARRRGNRLLRLLT